MGRANDSYFEETNIHRNSALVAKMVKRAQAMAIELARLFLGGEKA